MPEAMTLVITRPKEDAEKLAEALKEKGFHCIIEPVLSIKMLYRNVAALEQALTHKPQAIVATSKHAISAFAVMVRNRSIPVITVGKVTANYALSLGFKNVISANGNAKTLIAYIKKNNLPAKAPLLYIRGKDISTDIAAVLGKSDFIVESVILYKTIQANKFSARLCKAISEKKVNSVLFFSQNTVKTYAELAISSNIAVAHNQITALCMSRAIADKAASLLNWKKVILFPSYIKNAIQ